MTPEGVFEDETGIHQDGDNERSWPSSTSTFHQPESGKDHFFKPRLDQARELRRYFVR